MLVPHLNDINRILLRFFFILFFSCALLHPGHSQPDNWGEPVNGIQFGLQVKEDSFSYYYRVYVRCQKADGDIIYLGRHPRFSFFFTRFGITYQVIPAKHKNITHPDDELRFGLIYDRGWPLRCGDEFLVDSYVIPKIKSSRDSPCNPWFDDIDPDTAYFDVSRVLHHPFQDSTIYSSNKVFIPYCAEGKARVSDRNNNARFLNKLIKYSNGTPLQVAEEIAKDTMEDDLFRGIAGHLLSKMNTEESRQVLFDICSNPQDKDLEEMLSCFFRTRDERYIGLIDRYYNHSNDTVHQEIAWAIGEFKSEKHFSILLNYSGCEVSYTRRIATQSLKYFNNNAARRALHKRLEDTDFMIRSDAVHSLAEIGDNSSIKSLYDYIEREYPAHVGYYQDAMKVIEKITGEEFENDIEKLRKFMDQ